MGKWNHEKILSDLKSITEEIGKFPTHRDLLNKGRSDLRNAVIASGKKISEYATQIGEKSKQRPRDFWTPITIKEELRKVCEEWGHFPTRKELMKNGYCSLNMAMWQDGKTIQYWQKLLGYETKRHENGYWDNEDTIIKEFIEFAEEYGFLPTQQAMTSNSRHDLSRAIDRSGKGLAYFQKLAGFKPPFYEASDGHFLDSSYELALDEWLHEHGIRHDVHGYIDRKHGKYRYDFKIGDTYVEVWGYSKTCTIEHAEEYNEKRKLKEELYTKLNLDLISLEGEFFLGSSDVVKERIAGMFSRFI
jgi:hypothetical protein